MERLKAKHRRGSTDLAEEIRLIKEVEEQQKVCYDDDIQYIARSVEKLTGEMKKLEEG